MLCTHLSGAEKTKEPWTGQPAPRPSCLPQVSGRGRHVFAWPKPPGRKVGPQVWSTLDTALTEACKELQVQVTWLLSGPVLQGEMGRLHSLFPVIAGHKLLYLVPTPVSGDMCRAVKPSGNHCSPTGHEGG